MKKYNECLMAWHSFIGFCGHKDFLHIGKSVTCIANTRHGSMVRQLSSLMVTKAVPQRDMTHQRRTGGKTATTVRFSEDMKLTMKKDQIQVSLQQAELFPSKSDEGLDSLSYRKSYISSSNVSWFSCLQQWKGVRETV